MKSATGKFTGWASVGLVVAALALSGCPAEKKKTDTATQDKAAALVAATEAIQSATDMIASASTTPVTVPCAFGGTLTYSGTFDPGTPTGTNPVITTTALNLSLLFSNCDESGTVLNGTATMTANDTTTETTVTGGINTVFDINQTFTMTNFSVSGPAGSAAVASASVATTGTMAVTFDSKFTMNLAFTVTVDGHTCSTAITETTVQPAVTCN